MQQTLTTMTTACTRPLISRRRALGVIASSTGAVATTIAGGAHVTTKLLSLNISPRPGAYVVRTFAGFGNDGVKATLAAHAPETVSTLLNQQYRDGDDDAFLDVYLPDGADRPGVKLPTVIWTHGGAWVAGAKDDVAGYYALIAAGGYAVISLGYSLGPDKTYPTAINQINDALAYIQKNADRFRVDVDQIVLAGDSAGAQLTSQIATIITSPSYAEEVGITPSLRADQLRGTILFCGIYDMRTFLAGNDLPEDFVSTILGWGVETVVWAYTGSRNKNSDAVRQMSTIDYVTPDFPATFISGGNADPFTAGQSMPLAEKLEALGVDVHPLFFSSDGHTPPLGHEYQNDLGNPSARLAFARMMAFLEDKTDGIRPTANPQRPSPRP